ncbi:MAG: YbaB/EbfC family nucleoid-associated protein [Alphaproteobacteria bacterium]
MKNLGQLMKQAQQMQAKMEEMQAKLAEAEIAGQSGGGMVSVTLNGKGAAKAVKIDPSLIDPADPEVLEDLVVAAINDARAKLDSFTQEQMGQLAGGLQLPPGFKLPF